MANSISHAALPYPIKNARFTVEVPYLDADGDPTDPTTPDTEISQDGGSFADAAEEVTTITGSNGAGYITLTGAETNNSSVVVAFKVASGPKNTLGIFKPRVLAIVGSGTLSAGSAGGGTLGTLLAYDVTGCFIRTTGGTGGGGTGGANNQARKIITYTTSTGAFTVAPNWETTPDNTTTYDVLLPEGVTLGMLRTLNPATAGRTVVVDASGLVDANAVKVGPTGSGTAQTARDIGASVLLSPGTGTGQVKLASGYVAMTWADIAAPTTVVNLSGTTVKTATDVETDTVDIQSRIPAALTAGGNIKADALALSGDTVAADNAESFFDGTGYAGTNNVIPTVSTLAGHTPQTGDSYPKVNELHAATVAATGTVGATRTASSFFTNLTQSNNYWNDAILVFTSGNMDGISVIVEDFANTNGEVITSETMPLTPDAGITFTIVSRHTHSTAAIATATDTAVTDGITGTAVLAIQQILTGITSMADWIRRIVRKDAGTAGMVTAQAEINTGGTATFDGTTDSLEGNRDRSDVTDIKTKADQLTFTVANKVDATATATIAAADIRSALGMAAADLDDQLDAILAAASASAGSGARTVTITVNDGATALQNAIVRMTEGVNSYRAITNASGVAVFNLDDATYTVSVTKPGYTYAGTTLVVNGTETATYSMTLVSVSGATNPALSAIEVLCLGADFEAEAGIDVDFRMVVIATGDTNKAYPGLKVTVTSNGSGIARWEAPQSATIEYKRGEANVWQRATLDADSVTNVTSVIGSP